MVVVLAILMTMSVFVPVDDNNADWDIWTLKLVESEFDASGLDRQACGLMWSGCTLWGANTIYVIGTGGCNLWHELYHARGHMEHYNYCD